MQEHGESIFCVDHKIHSDVLKILISPFSQSAFLVLTSNDRRVGLYSSSLEGRTSLNLPRKAPVRVISDSVQRLREYALEENDIAELDDTFPDSGNEIWKAVICCDDNGSEELLAFRMDPAQEIGSLIRVLEHIWPTLRKDCLNEISDRTVSFGDDALLWMASNRIDEAILVLDEKAQIVRQNLAARELLNKGNVLKREGKRLVASNPCDTGKLASALKTCATSETFENNEEILFLEGGAQGTRVPVSLSRYYHLGHPTQLVVAMLPMPPDPARIELLGRKLGLTPSEARVAVLMQSGLTNREAACRAGLKEQTFNTYAKRVLCKLNVAGRTEMAQLLTWQAAGRRIA